MKFELDVVKFNVNDVITASSTIPGCENPAEEEPLGNAPMTCPDGFVG